MTTPDDDSQPTTDMADLHEVSNAMAMLCCVSRKAAGASSTDSEARCRASAELTRFVEVCRDLNKVREHEDEALRQLDQAVQGVTDVANSFSTFRKLETLPEESFFDAYRDSQEGGVGELQQCTVCDRKFASPSYERHVKICERTAARKRKPFDSAKQRIKGTDLAEFVQHVKPNESIHEHHHHRRAAAAGSHVSDDNRHHQAAVTATRRASGPAWKEKSEELRRSIKAVKDKTQQSTATTTIAAAAVASPPSQTSSPSSSSTSHHNNHSNNQQQQRPSTLSMVSSPGAPQRSNEKGTCPTCQRQFGVKSYDRHVAFCRERATRVPSSPQLCTNVAKERLEARMKYRAPGLKNRKPTNKEKYSSSGQQQQQHQKIVQSPLMSRSTNVVDSPKLPQLKRPSQTKESPIPSNGPLKSRPMDRSNRSSDSQESLNPAPVRQLFASRRLLLLSEVLPSKILMSKNSLSSSSSQKSSARLVTNFLQKEFSEPDSPSIDKPESMKQKLKKKIRFRARCSSKKVIVNQADEDDQTIESIEMVELTETNKGQEQGDYLTWQQIREEVRNTSAREHESIDKIEEPIISHRTGMSSSHDEANSTMDEFEMNERMVMRDRDSGQHYVSDDDDHHDHDKTVRCEDDAHDDNVTMDRTYVIDDATVSLSVDSEVRVDVNEENQGIDDADLEKDDEEDDLSVASTKTFKKSHCEKLETQQPQENLTEMTTPRIGESPKVDENISEKTKDDSNLRVDENNELTIVTDIIKEKLLNRPKKYLSLPNIADMKQQRTPRVSRLNVDNTEIREDNKEDEQTTRNTAEMHLPAINNRSTRRCATYVIDKPSGDNNGSKPLESRDSKMLYDYYRNASFSDLSSVRTDDLQITDYDFDDFTDENESNASELLKEIDACLMNTNLRETQDSIDFARKNRGVARRCRNARGSANSEERNNEEETSESTIELSDLRSEKQQLLEKEICTISRLERDNSSSFLPPIASNRMTDYRREKFVKSKALRDIAERDTPRDDENDVMDDQRFDRFSKSRTRSRRHSERRSHLLRSYERLPRCDLNSYIRRHPNFSRLLKSRIGNSNYDPFYILAEQQMNDLFSDTSDQSSTDGSLSICPPQKVNSSPNFPLSHGSAFVKYPNAVNGSVQSQSVPNSADKQQQQPQRASVIAPPVAFDDLTSSDISSECTETNSLSRELLSCSSSSNCNSLTGSRSINGERDSHVLGRRMIIDQNEALGGGEFAPSSSHAKLTDHSIDARSNRPLASCYRSNSMRAVSAPKPPERQTSSSSSSTNSRDFPQRNNNQFKSELTRSANNNNFKNQLNSSNVSLNSIFSSSDLEMKRSASLFDELFSSFEDDVNSTSTLPSLMSLIRNDPLLSGSAPQQQHSQQQQNRHNQRTSSNNGRINCSDDDAELSSPESVKRQECGKLSADSAYSSLNRKYSNHGRSTNDVNNASSGNSIISNKYKMSKFCHECGCKFPDSAKFCCECGVRRLTL